MSTRKQRAKLIIRNATTADIPAIDRVGDKVYPSFPAYPPGALRGQINTFPEGQFVAEYEGEVIGYCASLRVTEDMALTPHTYAEITGGQYGSTHVPDGNILYAMEVFVDPDHRGMRVGQRFYRARKELCRRLRLKAIVFGGRLPGLARRLKKVGSVESYIEQVQQKKMRDQVLSFQLRQGFEVLGVLENYLPYDRASLGYATHMIWRNPQIEPDAPDSEVSGPPQLRSSIRVACVQYRQRWLASYEEFEQIVEYFVEITADYGADFTVFPELFGLQLLSLETETLPPDQAILRVGARYDEIREMFQQLAMRYNVNLIAGTYPLPIEGGGCRNTALVCLRDGAIYEQPKVHPTPNERYWWNMRGGHVAEAIDTDCGPIGVLICYDAEFPELARHVVDQGAKVLFVPFCTDERQSYLRVRYCAQARAVENQCYVVMAGNVGNLPRVDNMELQYAQSCVLTPCDFPFSRDGIAADSTPNVETVVFADLRLEDLHRARHNGTVKNLKDRRHDLYRIVWEGRE